MENNKNKIYNLAAIGLMAAMVFVATNFRIQIPTALGKTMIHLGNVFCLLAGLTLGGVRGGLAAGIGSMFFDLVDPAFIASAPFTLVFKGIMGFLAGYLSHSNDPSKKITRSRIIAAAATGAITYVILYIGKGIITNYFFLRNPIETVMVTAMQSGVVSLVNAIIAVIVSVILEPVFTKSMKVAGIWYKLYPEAKPQQIENN